MPQGLAVDGKGHLWVSGTQFYTSGQSAIVEYGSNASGNATPINTIAGGKTGLTVPLSVALDGSGNIWVANSAVISSSKASIEEFSASASGNAKPLVVISGSNTDLNTPYQLTIDDSAYGKGRIVVADVGSGDVLVFDPSSSGDATPDAEITSVQLPAGVATDSAGHIYVSSWKNSAIHEFARDANGFASAIFSISGPYTHLSSPFNLYLRTL